MALETKDRWARVAKFFILTELRWQISVFYEIGYCPSCDNLFSPVDRDDIIECPVCHNKIYGRAIAINNGFLVEKEDILQ